jgi:hypothetical protein
MGVSYFEYHLKGIIGKNSLFAPFLQLARAASSQGALRLQIFTSKMSEGGLNFLKTGKRGRVGYEVRQRVNECASRKTRGVTVRLPETGAATHLVTKQISRPTPRTTQL